MENNANDPRYTQRIVSVEKDIPAERSLHPRIATMADSDRRFISPLSRRAEFSRPLGGRGEGGGGGFHVLSPLARFRNR